MHTRLSKIARLPAEIREQLNRRLHNGELGRTLLKWVNQLPETKTILAELFEGKPITHQNLSEWRRSGYQDWLQHQQRLEWFDRLTEQEADLEAHDRCGDTFETLSRFFVFEIGQALAALQTIKNPDDRWARLQNLTHEFARLQNAYNWSRRVQLEWDKFNDTFETDGVTEPEPQIEDHHDESMEKPEPEEIETPEPITNEFQNQKPLPLAPPPNSPPPEPPVTSHPETIEPPAPTIDTAPSNEPAQPPIKFQPNPTCSPTTHPIPKLNSQPSRWLRHTSPPIRVRGFICVEG